jgi:hypothetical protein
MSKSLFRIVALFILVSSASGQELASKTKPEQDSKTERKLITKAEALLAETVRNVQGLKNKENQIIARVAVADLLWKDHEKSARVLYGEALDNLRQALTLANDIEEESDDDERSLQQLRDRVLESLGQHDPLMARDFLRLSRVPLGSDSAPSEKPNSPNRGDSDNRLEVMFAVEMVDKNPTEAVRVAKEALKEGYPHELISLLSKLKQNDPKAARALAEEIVGKLRKEDFVSNYEASSLAVALVQEAISSTKVKEGGPPSEQQALLDPQTSKEFVEFLVAAAFTKQSGPVGMSLLMNLQSINTELEELAPAQASLIKQKFEEISKASGAGADPFQGFQQALQTNDTKAMLELAQKAPREVREDMYSQAANLAWQQGDKAKANEIITTKISSPIVRHRLLANFQEQTIADLIGREEFGEARQLIGQVRSGEQRVAKLIELAAALTEKGDKKAALEILREAQGLMTGKARNRIELEAQLRIAEAYSAIDADRSFALIGSAFNQINELLTATALIANFGYSPIILKDDEFVIDSDSIFPYGFAFSSRTIRTLAQADYEKTKEMFDRLERPEIRIAAYLFMSKSILEPEPTSDNCTCPEELKKLKNNTVK